MTSGMTRALQTVVIAGCTGFLLTSAGCARKAEKPKLRPPALVVTAAASQRDVPIQLRAIGTMEASESVTIRTQLSGELIKVAFREGQEVQKGSLLFQLDPRSYQALIRRAEATLARDRVILANARRDYERYSQLVKDGIVTHEQAEGYRTKAESAAADVDADQASLDSAREQLSYCTISAPISGCLGVLAVDRGNVVKANDTVLVTINKLTPIHASFTIPEKDLPEIKRHMANGKVMVLAEVPGNSGIKESGVISFFDNTVDPATGTIRLKGSFENSRKQLWPGQFVNLSIVLAVKNNATVVPSQSIQTGQKGQFVFVVTRDATAEIRPVVVGPVSGGMTVIEKGLQPGEQVVIDGQMRVVPGGKVEVKQPDKPTAPPAAAPASPPKPDQPGTSGK
jgi:multidrug efflux system membrane fusion protein